MRRIASGLVTAMIIGASGPGGELVHYRTRGAVSARAACGFDGANGNLLANSTKFPDGWWPSASSPGTAPAIETGAADGPTGRRDAARIAFDILTSPTAGRWSCIETTTLVTPGQHYTLSFSVNGPAGSFINARGAAGRGYSRIRLSGKWQRVHLTEIAVEAEPSLRIGLGSHDAGEPAAPSAVTVLLWGPQLVLGAKPVPYQTSDDVPAPAWPLELVAPGATRTSYPPTDVPEPEATNLLRWTTDLRRAPWERIGFEYVHSSIVPSPTGELDSFMAAEGAAKGPHMLSQRFDCAGPGPIVASAFVHASQRRCCMISLSVPGGTASARFDPSDRSGAVASAAIACRVSDVGRGWLRLELAAEASGPGVGELAVTSLDGLGGGPTHVGDGSQGLILWGPQVERGSRATSYIPTFFIPETREADEVISNRPP